MYRSSQLRNTGHTLLPQAHVQAQDQAQDLHHHLPSQLLPSSVSLMPPPSSSSSSLASSFSSSAHSSMLLPPGPAGATQSNVLASSDHVLTHPTPRPVVAPVPSKNTNNKFFALNISPAPRSASLAHMGQGGSRAASVPPSNPTTITPTTTNSSSSFSSSSNGGMFKRWQHGRRRKSEDANVVLSGDEGGLSQITKGKERELLDQSRATTATVSATSASSSAQSGAQVHPHNPPVPPPSKPSKHIFSSAQLSSTFSVFGSRNRHANSPTKSPKVSNSAPMPPPKPLELKGKKLPAAPVEKPIPTPAEPMPSRVAPSPLPSSSTPQLSPTPRPPREPPREEHSSPKEKPDFDIKQDWRKSDSTMTSHGTIRPGALGNRSPRPVSLAESSHSGHTVVPVNKRLSALLTDAEFVMPEEGDLADTDSEPTIIMGGSSGRPSVSSSPQSSLSKSRNRRSMSLGAPTYLQRSKASTPEPTHTPAYDASTSGSPINRTLTDTTSLSQSWSRDSPTITKASAKGFIAPTAAPGAAHNTGSNIRSRLAAWTSAANRSDRALSPPPVHPRRGLVPPPSPQPSFRQTAVSMTGGLAPAAGIAMGIGKRAAEKVHRVWGGFSSSSSSNSGYSSSSSAGTGTAPSSYNSSRHSDNILGRSASDLHSSLLGNVTAGGQTNSGAGPGWKARRRTPNAPSGSWSFASSTTSVSDVEGLTRPAGPSLGTLLRTPKRTRSGGSVAGGLVFGRDLQVCVQETAVDGVRNARKDGVVSSGAGGMRPLEERLVPALVVRCAQHLKMWGVQEEGLFRVSGRPAHVAKLRSEFDTGADYNLSECDPGELDPHAVASIFKAYLRELPQSLLTAKLSSHFESALASEADDGNTANNNANTLAPPKLTIGSKNPSLPAGPKAGLTSGFGLRKPPSLSTLALPSFAALRATSDATIEALAVLIALLPQENKDLLYTLVELIQATAERSKDTKMPLGNLLLVFCPSLNMSATLLRVLCEAKNIWNGPPPKVPSKPSTPEITPSHPESQTVQPSPRAGLVGLPLVEDQEPGDAPSANLRVTLSSSCLGSSKHTDSPHDDRDSYVSALDSAEGNTQPPSPVSDTAYLPQLSSSTDSLATPSTLSEDTSFTTPSVVGKPYHAKLSESSYSRSPTLADSTDAPLSSPTRRVAVSSPIPFPSTGGNQTHTPLVKRKSFTMLSFPPLRQQESQTTSNASPPLMTRRSKRPSLTLLFSKRSASSLPSATESTPAPSSAPVLTSHFAGAYTAPPTTVSPPSTPMHIRTFAPPVLETTISSSPIRFAFDHFTGHADSKPSSNLNPKARTPATTTTHTSPVFPITDDAHSQMPGLRVRADSSASSLYTTPQSTPQDDIARSRSRFSSLVLPSTSTPTDQTHLTVSSPTNKVSRTSSQTSLTPSIDVGLERSKEGDWAKSVLRAAHAESPESRSQLSVKEVVKVFEGK